MATRKISRGTPAVLSKHEQELLVKTAEDDPEIREALEYILQRPWGSLTFGQKVTALCAQQEQGRALATHAAALRGRADFLNAVATLKGEESKSEVIERQQATIAYQREQLTAADQKIADLTAAYDALPPKPRD